MADLLADDPQARKRRKTIALSITALAAILLVAALIWWNSLPDTDDAAAIPGAPTVLTAQQLAEAYERDPDLAGFGSEPMIVTGSIIAPPVAEPVVAFSTPPILPGIAAELEPGDARRLADIAPRTVIVLRCAGITRTPAAPTLQRCRLEEIQAAVG